jgi:hypothetical protein
MQSLYARRPIRATRLGTAFKDPTVVSFKDGQAGVEQLTLRDDDDVEPCCNVVPTKNLSYQSFSSVSLNSSAELFRSCNAQTPDRELVGENEHRREAPVNAGAAFVNGLVLGPTPNVLVRPEPGQAIRC